MFSWRVHKHIHCWNLCFSTLWMRQYSWATFKQFSITQSIFRLFSSVLFYALRLYFTRMLYFVVVAIILEPVICFVCDTRCFMIAEHAILFSIFNGFYFPLWRFHINFPFHASLCFCAWDFWNIKSKRVRTQCNQINLSYECVSWWWWVFRFGFKRNELVASHYCNGKQ